jgi:hypothetical protein
MQQSTRLLPHMLVALLLVISVAAPPRPATGNTAAGSAHRDQPSSLLAPSSMAASISSAPAIELLNSIGGSVYSAVIDGTFAYLIEGNTLLVLDVSNPATPLLHGRVRIHDVRGDANVVVAGGHAYISHEQMLEIIDVSDPAAPRVVGSHTTSFYGIDSVQVVAQRAYLLYWQGFELLDISDPAQPRYIGRYERINDHIQVVGNLVYVLSEVNGGLTILDLSDPAHVLVRGTYQYVPAPGESFSYQGLYIKGDRAYITLGIGPAIISYHLLTLDVSDPDAPLLLGKTVIVYSDLKTVSGNLAFIQGDYGDRNLYIYDLSDPSHAILQSTYPLIAKTVQVVGQLAYIISSGLWILDMSDPAHPSVRGSYTSLGISKIAIPASGNMAYVGGDQFQILDLTNPITPTLRGSYTDAVSPLYIAGTHVYAGGYQKLLAFDVTNPDAPTLSSSIALTGTLVAAAGANNLLYVLSFTQHIVAHERSVFTYLNILDVSDPSNPIVLGSINRLTYISDINPGLPGAIVLAGTLAYAATGETLEIIDISNPAHPQVRTHYDTPGHASYVQIIGDLAYVADAEAGLSILDISDRLNPTVRGRYQGSACYYVLVKDGLAYLIGEDKLLIVDVHDPTHPVPRASYGGVRGQLQIVGDLVYMATYYSGLYILRVHPDRFPSPAFLPLVQR